MQREALESFALFRRLPEVERARVARAARRKTLRPREAVFEAGSAADALFAVCDGYLKVSALTEQGTELTMGLFGQGDVFGEPALLVDGPRVARVVALSACTLLSIDGVSFEALLGSCPGLARGLLVVLAERSRHLVHHHVAIASLPVARRLARKVLVLSRDAGAATPRRIRIVPSLSQQDLADMTATTRQSVNEHLRRWTKQGYVDSSADGLVVVHPAALEGIAQGEEPPAALP